VDTPLPLTLTSFPATHGLFELSRPIYDSPFGSFILPLVGCHLYRYKLYKLDLEVLIQPRIEWGNEVYMQAEVALNIHDLRFV